MLKNIIVYLITLISVFAFNIFYYEWFSWFLLLLTISLPVLSLIISLPFMILNARNGFSVFGNESIKINDDFLIGTVQNKKIFFPLMKIKLSAENDFAKEKGKIKIICSGYIDKPVFSKQKNFGKNCGCVEVKTKYCRVYDFLGLFFIPSKINSGFETYIMPNRQAPNNLPKLDNILILGYKPKQSGACSEYYEVREYRQGDSLKDIHWKLSSKLDKLMSKEANIPVFKPLSVVAFFEDKADENNCVLSKLAYIFDYLAERKIPFFVSTNRNSYTYSAETTGNSEMLIKRILGNQPYNITENATPHSLSYYIYSNREEVIEE